MGTEDEIRKGMQSEEKQAAWHAERRRRAEEINAGIQTFLPLMRGHGNAGAIRILESSPSARPRRSFLNDLFLSPHPSPAETIGWQVSETTAGIEITCECLVLTVDGDLFRAHAVSEGGWNPATGRWGPTVWVREAPFQLGDVHDDISERLERGILSGVGKIVQANGLSWPGS